MGFEDEKRLEAKKQLNNQPPPEEETVCQSIYDEHVTWKGQQYVFERREIEDLGISIYMPKTFRLMTVEEKELAFPRTKPPLYAYLGDHIPFSMAVNITESPLLANQVKVFLKYSRQIIENMVPKAKVLRTYMSGTEDFPVGNAEFLSMGFDGMIYNVMLFVSVSEKLLVIDLSFGNADKKLLLELIKEMAESLRLGDKDESDDI